MRIVRRSNKRAVGKCTKGIVITIIFVVIVATFGGMVIRAYNNMVGTRLTTWQLVDNNETIRTTDSSFGWPVFVKEDGVYKEATSVEVHNATGIEILHTDDENETQLIYINFDIRLGLVLESGNATDLRMDFDRDVRAHYCYWFNRIEWVKADCVNWTEPTSSERYVIENWGLAYYLHTYPVKEVDIVDSVEQAYTHLGTKEAYIRVQISLCDLKSAVETEDLRVSAVMDDVMGEYVYSYVEGMQFMSVATGLIMMASSIYIYKNTPNFKSMKLVRRRGRPMLMTSNISPADLQRQAHEQIVLEEGGRF